MAKHAAIQFTAVDGEGNVMPSATVTVRTYASGTPLASLFTDRDGLVAKTNPGLTDSNGFFQAYASGRAYKITVELGAQSRTWDHVAVGTAAEYDADNLLFALLLCFTASLKPGDNEVLVPVLPGLACNIPVDFEGSVAYCREAPTAEAVISITQNEVEIGTITFAIGENEGVFSALAEPVALSNNDRLSLTMPSPVDASFADISVTIIATR